VDEAEIAVGGFVVSGRQPSGILDLIEAAFDHVAQGIDAASTGNWISRFRWAGSWRCRRAFHILADEVSIIAHDKAVISRASPTARTALNHERLKTDPLLVAHQTTD
jgi:hypothetical protein